MPFFFLYLKMYLMMFPWQKPAYLSGDMNAFITSFTWIPPFPT